jgi:5-hydroxyisourate hydrolase
MSKLTTHVLDTVKGIGAGGMRVSLHMLLPAPKFIADLMLDGSGRGSFKNELSPGTYELQFAVGDYHKITSHAGGTPPFLDVVPIRFGVEEIGDHYHIPLILSLFGYSTYRGR